MVDQMALKSVELMVAMTAAVKVVRMVEQMVESSVGYWDSVLE